jgi:hypothetical protein
MDCSRAKGGDNINWIINNRVCHSVYLLRVASAQINRAAANTNQASRYEKFRRNTADNEHG